MPGNAFDDLPPGLAPPPTATPAQSGRNAFDDIGGGLLTAPPAKEQKPPATAADRVQATEGGFLKGAAYLAGLPADAILNTANLGRAAAGAAYLGLGGKPSNMPAWLDPASSPTLRPNPSGAAISELMDMSPVTTTQPVRPDDAASRYLSTAGSVLPGALTGGGGIPTAARNLAVGVPAAAAGQYVGEAKPFKSDTANNAAAVLTQALGATAANRVLPTGRGAPVQSPTNDAVRAGQEAGYVFPPATTNPTLGNRAIESVAGKTAVQQHASIENQEVTNNQGRAALGVPEAQGPISDAEIAQAKAQAAPGYQALRGAGQIIVPMDWTQRLTAALSKQSGAAKLDPSLADSQLDTTVANLSRLKNFDAADGLDTISALRDRASVAFNQGNAQAGRAYRDTSKVIEDAIDFDLSRNDATADVVQNFRDSRARFAAIANVEDARNPATGNLQAQKLAAALNRGEYLGPDGSPLRVSAEAAGQAPRAFAEPTSSAASHASVFESGLGAVLGEGAFGHWGLLGAAAIPAARWGARNYALGDSVLGIPLGQRGAVQTQPVPTNLGVPAGLVTALQGAR